VTAEVRAACREAWGAEVIAQYGAGELNWIALQCPDHEEHYHVQAESALVEVLDDREGSCEPGAVGRVVVTPLHNFAMPLLRYAVGDYAEVGAPCPCGRGLPVLARVLGRARNMLRLPSGATVWPEFQAGRFRAAAPVRQFQVVQRSLDELELRLAVERPLTAEEEAALRGLVIGGLGQPFAITISYHREIPRSAVGKYEDFRSELTD
jgi:phenylacetate-CoA ligase